MNEILTALLREERLEIVHDGVRAGPKDAPKDSAGAGKADGKGSRRASAPALFDPYTLLVYKKGLYLAGFSHAHGQVRTLALDGFRDVTWRRGDAFPYPADFHPADLAEGAFGLIKGPPATVRVFFTEKVARYVTRRQWHPTQKVKKVPGGIELTLNVKGTVELASWILSFGDQAEVRAPDELRTSVRGELGRALGRYARVG